VNDFIKENNKKQDEDLLVVSGLTVSFGGLTAVDGMDFKISDRGIRGVIGPNGAGKTTFFNAITGFVKAKAGSVLFKGEELLGLPTDTVAKRGIIRTFQNGGIFPEMSVIENVLTGYHRLCKSTIPGILLRSRYAIQEENDIIDRAIQYLETVGLSDIREQRAGDLSYGQQRIVEITRALFSKPTILFLDEPAAGLSSAEQQKLIDHLKRIAANPDQYIVLTDHSMMTICDFITVMNFGKKIGEGTPKEIQNNQGVIEAYLGRE
jgi:branched-chain amino acid transport system ATP-binding protein